MKVIGVEIKSGNYKGIDYCNVVFSGTYPIKNGVGESVSYFKVKHSKLCEILGVTEIDNAVISKRLIGRNIEPAFDRYQKVNYITEVPTEKAG